jgi:hypothetical protein
MSCVTYLLISPDLLHSDSFILHLLVHILDVLAQVINNELDHSLRLYKILGKFCSIFLLIFQSIPGILIKNLDSYL